MAKKQNLLKCHDDLRIYQFLFKKRDVSTTEQRTLNIKACFRSLYRSLLCIYMFLQIIIYSNNKNLFLPCLPGSNFLKITKHILYNCISKSRSLYCNELVYSSIPSKYFHWPHVTLKWCQSAGLVISTNTKHVHGFFFIFKQMNMLWKKSTPHHDMHDVIRMTSAKVLDPR